MDKRIWMRRAAAGLFWIAVWQAASLLIPNPIIFVGPAEVVRSLARLVTTLAFWSSVSQSLVRIALGFLAGLASGLTLGGAACRFRLVKDLLEPPMLLMKSVPVASFVILALIWAGSRGLSTFISFLVVLPILYINTVSGLESTDPKLLEMARVFRMSAGKRLKYLYHPALRPYLISGCKIALGMSWKSGVAAEVIGVPEHSIGEQLYMAKIYLNTADLFAWTLVIVLVSAAFEKIVLAFLKGGPGGSKNQSAL